MVEETDSDRVVILYNASPNGTMGGATSRMKRADVNAKDSQGMTALHRASLGGCREKVRCLLREPSIDVNLRDDTGDTPLILATLHGHTEVVELLLQKEEIAVNLKDTRNGRTALHSASIDGRAEVVGILLQDRRLDVNLSDSRSGFTPLHYASMYGHVAVVELLLQERRVDVNMKSVGLGATALHVASLSGQVKVVELLLQREEIDVNVGVYLKLEENRMTKGADEPSPRRLRTKGAIYSPRTVEIGKGRIPSYRASSADRVEIGEVKTSDEDELEPRKAYVCRGLAYLNEPSRREQGTEENVTGGNKLTALHCAAIEGHADIVALLLQKEGIDVASRDPKNGLTALDYALYNEHRAVASLLLRRDRTFP